MLGFLRPSAGILSPLGRPGISAKRSIAGENALGRIIVVNDPAIIRHVLVDNAANYRKDDLQLRCWLRGSGGAS